MNVKVRGASATQGAGPASASGLGPAAAQRVPAPALSAPAAAVGPAGPGAAKVESAVAAAAPGAKVEPAAAAGAKVEPAAGRSARAPKAEGASHGSAPAARVEPMSRGSAPAARVEPTSQGPTPAARVEPTSQGSAPAAKAPRLSARERLLAAADELFYENGINTVGIDRIIEHAGVAKASLYDCFGSKDELVRAYLRQRSLARQARINERMSRYHTPEEKILSLFDLLIEVTSQPDYRGCAFVRAGADANSSEGVKTTCGDSRAFLLHTLTDLARDAGASDAELIGKQLVLLYDGASTAAYMDGDRNAGSTARTLAEQMLSNMARAKRD